MLKVRYYAIFVSTLCALSFFITNTSIADDQALPWKRVQGSATDIAVAPDGEVAAVDKSGNVYDYNHSAKSWRKIGSGFVKIAAQANSVFWGIDKRGSLRRYSGTQWQAVGSGASDLAIDQNGMIYVTTNKNTIAIYNSKSRKWSSLRGSAKHIAIDLKGLIWAVDQNGNVSRKLDDAWIGVNGQATDIAADDQGRMFITSADGKLYIWNEAKTNFEVYNGVGTNIAVSAGGGQIWTVKSNAQIFAQGLGKYRKQNKDGIIENKSGDGGSTDPSQVVDNSPIVFEQIPGNIKLTELSIGQDGSIFGLTSSGDIRRWSNNERRFYNFPGRLGAIKVQTNGLPVGIGVNDNLLEHDGEAWRQINLPQRLIDFDFFNDDKILALNTSEQPIKLSENKVRFELLGGQKGQQIAVNTDNSYWLIDNVDRLFRCNKDAECQIQPLKATDIDIGPAGSVFIVDTNNALRKLNINSGNFEIIPQSYRVSRVALGPNDRPWILDNQGRVFASKFFDRDEINDRRLATKTKATEDVTTEQPNVDGSNSGVQIVQSVSFTPVTIPTSASGFPDLGKGLRDITVGENDIVIATGFADPCVKGNGANWVYNPNSRSFSYLDYLKGINLYVALAIDDLVKGDINGDIPPSSPIPSIPSFIGEWNKDCENQSELITYVGSVFQDASVKSSQNFSGASFSSEQPLNTIPDIDLAADGTIINLFGVELEFFQPETANDVKFFDQINFLRAGIGKNKKDIWAISTTNNVYEFIESLDKFELRSNNGDDKAQDVGVGQDGTVFIVNMSGVLKKWDATSKRFIKTNKTGVNRVAVDSRGNPIVANFPDSQIVYFGR